MGEERRILFLFLFFLSLQSGLGIDGLQGETL